MSWYELWFYCTEGLPCGPYLPDCKTPEWVSYRIPFLIIKSYPFVKYVNKRSFLGHSPVIRIQI